MRKTRSGYCISSSSSSSLFRTEQTVEHSQARPRDRRSLPQSVPRDDLGMLFIRGDGDGFTEKNKDKPEAKNNTTTAKKETLNNTTTAKKETLNQTVTNQTTLGQPDRPIYNTAIEKSLTKRLFPDRPRTQIYNPDRVLRSGRSPRNNEPLFEDSTILQSRHGNRLFSRRSSSGSRSSKQGYPTFFEGETKRAENSNIVTASKRKVVFLEKPEIFSQEEVTPEVIGETPGHPTFDVEFSDEELSSAEEVLEDGNAIWDKSNIVILVIFAALRLLYESWSDNFDNMIISGAEESFNLSSGV